MRHLDMGSDPRSGREIAGDLAKARDILDRCAHELDIMLDHGYFEIERMKTKLRAEYEERLRAAPTDLVDALLIDTDGR